MAYKPRLDKQIQNLSRAINKIDQRVKNKLFFADIKIEDIEPGINTIKYRKNGVRQEIRYDELQLLSENEQGSLYSELTIERYGLRQEKALNQLKSKGKISWQFKRSLEGQNTMLLENIEKFEQKVEGNTQEAIKSLFIEEDEFAYEDYLEEVDDYFQEEGTPLYFDFYHVQGFKDMNKFTWSIYKTIRDI